MNDSATRKQYPNQGRWLSPDPAGLAAVDPSNPQSWNRYAYVDNNPVSFVDPLGMCDVFIGGFTQTPGTVGTQVQQDLASKYGADQAYPFSGLNPATSVLAAYGTTADTVTRNAILDAYAQTGSGNFTIYSFSGGAQTIADVWSSLPTDVQKNATIAFVSPGLVPFGGTLPQLSHGRSPIFKGQGFEDNLLTSLSPIGGLTECGHDANCQFQTLANTGSVFDGVWYHTSSPCHDPTTFTPNCNSKSNGNGGGGGGGGAGGGNGGLSGLPSGSGPPGGDSPYIPWFTYKITVK